MAARAQHVVSYDMLAKMTGVPRFGFAAIGPVVENVYWPPVGNLSGYGHITDK
jgi:hypothetical protein